MSPEQLLQELEAFDPASIARVPENFRARLHAAATSFNRRLESPTDAISRVLISQPIEEISIRIAADLGIFSALAQNKSATVSHLARITQAEPELLVRILRSLAAFSVIRENSAGEYSPVSAYNFFDKKEFEQAFGACQDILDKSRRGLPGFLRWNGYKNPHDPTNTAVQFAFNTRGQSYMDSLLSDPAARNSLNSFVTLMSVWAEGFTQIQDVYPIEQRLRSDLDPTGVTFLDVGGGLGQKAIALRNLLPDLPGKFVVQDLEQVIAGAPIDPGYEKVDLTVHDFTTDQPIKGAKCYYIRQCLHNWPDATCVLILRKLAEAAKPGYSRVLIHEIIVPTRGSGVWVASQDLNMMSMFAVGERTEADWRTLCNAAGLKVAGIFVNDHPSREGIIEAVC